MYLRLILGAMILVLVSCASTPKGTSEAEIAAGLASQGRYRDAIAAIDQAIVKEPRNQAYQASRQKYVSEYVGTVNQKVSTNLQRGVTKSSLDLADQLIEDAQAAGLSQSALAPAMQRLKQARDSFYTELQGGYSRAVAAMDGGDLLQAHKLLTSINERYPNYEDTTQRLNKIRQQASRDYLGNAGQLLKQDQLAEARGLVQKMLQIDPGNSIARNMLGKINERDNKAYFVDKVVQAKDAGDNAALEQGCRAVLSYDPQDEMCHGLLASLGKAQAASLVEATTEAISAGRLFEAADNYSTLHQYEDEGFQSARHAIKGSLAKRLSRTAEDAAEERQFGLAWVLYKKLEEVDPAYADLGSAIRGVEDSILARTRKSIAVFDFNSPRDNIDAGVIVANNLISRLFNNAGRDISILERENLKSILEEMKLGQIGVVSEDTAKEMGRIYGIDYAIMGSVLLYKVDTSNAKSSKTIKYQIGEEIQDNIDYLNWVALHPKPTRQELATAPQAKVKVPKYAITEYDVSEVKKVGFIGLSFRIVDVATGENTRVDTIERKKEVKDTGNEGLAEAGVAYNAMEVPTDTELLQLLTDDVVDSMSVDVLRPLQSLEKTYFESGEEFQKRNEPLKAIEFYVDGVFNERLKSVSASPLTAEAMKRIQQLMYAQSFDS